MDQKEQGSTSETKRSILPFFKPPNINFLLQDESEEDSGKDSISVDIEERDENLTTTSPRKGFNANDLVVRSKFTSFFCKPRANKSTKPPKSIEELSSPLKTNSKAPGSALSPIEIDVDADEDVCSTKMLKSPSSDSVICVEVVSTKRPAISAALGPNSKRVNSDKPSVSNIPVSPIKAPSSAIDLSQMDPILQAAFLKRQAQNKTACAPDNNATERSILFKIVPRVDPPRANPLFIRTRIDDSFGMLKGKIAKELHFAPDILVLVYDGVVLIDSSKPSTLNLLGTNKKVNDKEKAIGILLFTKSTWHQEQQLREQKRKTFMENAQFLNHPTSNTDTNEEEISASEADAYFSQTTHLQGQTLSVSIRTNKTGLQVFSVQVPKSAKVFDIVERFKATSVVEVSSTNVKVKFDGDLLPLSTEIGTVLENEDMVDLTF